MNPNVTEPPAGISAFQATPLAVRREFALETVASHELSIEPASSNFRFQLVSALLARFSIRIDAW